MKDRGCDVIVTYCWNRVGYNILRSLTAHGLRVWVADTSKRNICSMSRFCAGSFVYPDPFTDEEKFIEVLVGKVLELKPKVLMPTHDEGIVIARNRHRFPKDLIIPIESEEKLKRLSNKKTATELAAQAGLPIPTTYPNIEVVDNYPVVFKTVIGNSAKSVFFPKDFIELKELSQRFNGTEVLIEEWLKGGDVCVDCLRWGDFFQASVYRAIVTKTEGGGTTTQREIIHMPKLVEYSRQFLNYVDYNGVCGLDFRYDSESGKIGFIEMNARFTGGLATPVTAGFDIPYMLYTLSTGGKCDDVNVKIGTSTKWILGDVITLVSRLLSLNLNKDEMRHVARFKGFDAFDDFRKDDKRAIFGEMAYYFSKLIKNGNLNP
ncbi:MAG: ATP-grasp domain-containing protein [Muribaculaceae bacterium]|nr:ATP-grasp domain-containing protein [Muribaculaceae bacterium]